MNRFNAFEDEELFNLSTSTTSNLASIFNSPTSSKSDLNASLIYTPQKQPKTALTDGQPAKSNSQSSVICSNFVDAFKVIDKTPTLEGKCGFAIIGQESLKAFEIILYKSKHDIVTRCKLNFEFKFIVETNNFVYFCDDHKSKWCVRFQTSYELNSFTRQVTACGGSVICNTNQDAPKSDQSEKISPSDQINDKDSDASSDHSSNQSKASILSRMAKMGQPILPASFPTKLLQRSDSETDEEINSTKVVKKRHATSDKTKLKNNQATVASNVPECFMINGQLVSLSTVGQNLSNSLPITGSLIQTVPTQTMWNQAPSLSDPLNIFVAENRTHNCEMRMNMSQINAKLERVLANFDQNTNKSYGKTTIDTIERQEFEELKISVRSLKEREESLKAHVAKEEKLINELKEEAKVKTNLISKLERENRQFEEERVTLDEVKEENESLRQKISDLKRLIDIQDNKLRDLIDQTAKTEELSGEKIEKLELRLHTLDNKSLEFADSLKQAINVLYQQIMENFQDENKIYKNVDIKAVLAPKLKSASFNIIDMFHKDFKDN